MKLGHIYYKQKHTHACNIQIVILLFETWDHERSCSSKRLERGTDKKFTAVRQTGTSSNLWPPAFYPFFNFLLSSLLRRSFIFLSTRDGYSRDEENQSSSIQFHTWWSLCGSACFVEGREPFLYRCGLWKKCLFGWIHLCFQDWKKRHQCTHVCTHTSKVQSSKVFH